MTSTADRRADRFATLARLYELQLEHARVERAAIDKEVERQSAHVKELEAEIDNSHAIARRMVAHASGISVESLRQLHEYMRWQAGTLAEQQRVLERSRTLAEDARLHVVRRYERLAATVRMRDRHAKDAATLLWQRDQKALDDQAPIRAVVQAVTGTSIYKECAS